MILGHYKNWYNPFEVDGRELKNIYFYNKDGIKIHIGKGWFVDGDNTSSSMTLSYEVVYKRAPINFEKAKSAFLVKTKREYRSDDKLSDLYLPYVESEFEVSERRRTWDTYIEVRTVYKWLPQNIIFSVYKESIPIEENVEWERDMKALSSMIDSTYNVHKDKKAIRKEIKRLAEKYAEA